MAKYLVRNATESERQLFFKPMDDMRTGYIGWIHADTSAKKNEEFFSLIHKGNKERWCDAFYNEASAMASFLRTDSGCPLFRDIYGTLMVTDACPDFKCFDGIYANEYGFVLRINEYIFFIRCAVAEDRNTAEFYIYGYDFDALTDNNETKE